MSDPVLQATIKAYDEFSQQFQKFQQTLKSTNQEMDKTKQSAKGASDALQETGNSARRTLDSFYALTSAAIALYGIERAFLKIMQTGRQFELTIKQAQSVTGDFSRELRDLAMAGTGGGMLDVFTPTQLAEAYRELGAAGATTNEILAATPDILEFATAAIINMDESAYGVITTAKSFNIALEDAGQITDAYTESMNRGALTGKDFSKIMGSVGAVAKMAGQDFREILSIGSAMRDAGMTADEAGTTIKSALLALINPSKEAQDVLDQLDIKIYDASGNMKQWSDITKEFQLALAPFNEQSKNLALTTVFGSYGIRAMATSMNKGGEYLKEFTEGLKDADGATHEMAEAMADTLDGSIRRANASLERFKVLLFEDFAQGALGVLDIITAITTKFNELDESQRRAFEFLAGSVGLVSVFTLGLSLLGGAVGRVTVLIEALNAAFAGLNLSLGIVGAAIAVLSVAISGISAYTQARKQEAQAQAEANEKLAEYNRLIREGIPKERVAEIQEETAKIKELVEEYDKLSKIRDAEDKKVAAGTTGNLAGKTKEYLDAEAGIKKVNEELAKYGMTAETAKAKIEALNKRVAEATALDYAAAVGQANKAVETKKAADSTSALIQEYLTLTKHVKDANDITNLSTAEQSRLSVVVDELANKYPSMVTAIDEHGKAMLLDQDGMRQQMSVMKALALIETQEAKARIEAERTKTLVVIQETKNRMNAIIAEQQALRDANAAMTGVWPEAVLQSTPALARIVPGQRFAEQMSGMLSDEMKKRQETRVQAEAALKIYNEALANLDKGLTTTIPALGGAGTGVLSLGGDEAKKSAEKAAKEADIYKQHIEAITESLRPYRQEVEELNHLIAIRAIQEDNLNKIMESGQGTAYDAAELEKARSDHAAMLTLQQQALTRQIEAQKLALYGLQEQYTNATDPDSIKTLRDEIDNLTSSTYQLQQAWWQAEQEKLSLAEQVRQVEEKYYQDAYQRAIDLMRHQVNMAMMSTEQQIKYLSELQGWMKQEGEWTQQQMRSVEEDLYRLRRQQLSTYLSRLEDEYNDKLGAIEDRTKKTTDAIQRQIDALKDQGTSSSREEATRKYNQRLKELEDQRKYHELRTGLEHQKAIADIDEQMAEEKHQFILKQQEWEREDQIAHLQDKLDAARDEGQKERDELQKHYQKARKIAESGILDTIASLAATEPKWLQTGKNLIEALIDGLESGQFDVQGFVDRATGAAAKKTTTSPSTSKPSTPAPATPAPAEPEPDPSTMTWEQRLVYYKTHQAEAKAEIARAGSVYMQHLAAGNIEAAGSAHHWANLIREAIGLAKTYDGATASSSYKGYEKGGPIGETGLIYAHAGEYVLPANLVDAIRRGTMPPSSISGGGRPVQVILQGPVLSVESLHVYDDMDVERISMGLRKGIMDLTTARG